MLTINTAWDGNCLPSSVFHLIATLEFSNGPLEDVNLFVVLIALSLALDDCRCSGL